MPGAHGGQPESRSPVPNQATTLTQFVAKAGREAAVRDVLLSLVEPSRAEPGNISFDVHESKNMPWAFYVLGNWTTEASLDEHSASGHIRIFQDQAEPDLVASPTQTRARMLSSPDANPNRARPSSGSSSQVTLVPFFSIKPGQVDAVRDAHLRMIDGTRAEPGCMDYDLYQSVDDPSIMFFYENWTDQVALDQHMNTPAFYDVVRSEIDPLLAVPWTALSMSMQSDATGGPGPG